MAQRRLIVGIQKALFVENKVNYLKQHVKNIPNAMVNFIPINSAEEINQVEVLVSDVQFAIEALPYFTNNIKWVQLTWAGWQNLRIEVEKLDNHVIKQTLVTRMSEVWGKPTAEYVLGAVISIERGFFLMKQDQRNKIWRNPQNAERIERFRNFKDLSIGILGLGEIGLEIAKTFRKLGMTVYGVASVPKHEDIVARCYTTKNLDKFLSHCDYICNALPSTPDTFNLLSGSVLEICKQKKPGFINIGRGDIISEHDLLNALQNDWISFAFLDVFNVEPVPENSQLWNMENVIISPHVSSYSNSNLYENVFLDNLQKYVDGDELKYVINWKKGY